MSNAEFDTFLHYYLFCKKKKAKFSNKILIANYCLNLCVLRFPLVFSFEQVI